MAIDLRDVCFAYPGAPETSILNIKQWTVAGNEHIFVHGASGSGKSTLLNLLSGILSSSGGEVAVLGQRLDKMNAYQRDRFRANHIGYVFQQFNLIPYLGAVDNIQIASQFSKQKKSARLSADIENLLSRLNISRADWHKPSAKLSIGQQQRVAIARALINQPELLIADEPTSALDQPNSDNFMSLLMSLAKEHDITLLFVSHDMSLSRYFDRVDALSEINQSEASSPCL